MQREALAASRPLLSCAHSHGNSGFPHNSSRLGLLCCSLSNSQTLPQAHARPSDASLPLLLAFGLLRSLGCDQGGAHYPLLRAPVEALASRDHRNYPVLSGSA